jgi:hypothetical protein
LQFDFRFSSVVVPKEVAPGDSFNAYVSLQKDASRVYLVTASIRHPSNGFMAKDGPRFIRSGSRSTFRLTIPADAKPDRYTFQVKSSFPGVGEREVLSITVIGDNRIVLIQTDKPIYKPGDTGSDRLYNIHLNKIIIRFELIHQ